MVVVVVVVLGGGGGGGWVEVCMYMPLMHTSNLSWILDIFCSCPAHNDITNIHLVHTREIGIYT